MPREPLRPPGTPSRLGSSVRRGAGQFCFCDGKLPAVVLALISLFGLALVSGCSGCNRDRNSAEKEKSDEPPFEFADVQLLPTDPTLAMRPVKPGHFVEGIWRAKANRADVQADLEMAAINRRGEPHLIKDTRFRLVMTRPAALPKGQEKNFQTMYFIPQADGPVMLSHSLTAARGGAELDLKREPTTLMPGNQYYLVVLSMQPDRYSYWRQLESVRQPPSVIFREKNDVFYRVVLPQTDARVPLPSTTMAWTSLAYLIWDDLPPDQLTAEQQQSLVDWLHWGGQLIISGPNAATPLQESFLAPYLPVTSTETSSLGAEDLAEINEAWSLVDNRNLRRDWKVVPMQPVLGLRWTPAAGATAVPGTGDMVLERRVGRGRVVMTAFPLYDRDFINWGSLDNFVNGCLLRRPARKFVMGSDFAPEFEWRDHGKLMDARLMTTLRFFSRDVGQFVGTDPETAFHRDGHTEVAGSGVAGWNDHSGAAEEARQALRTAAGISIPGASFVWKSLALYLAILVPVNWGVFKLLGRVEWAWVATPLIAIGGTIGIAYFAQLDIGFARSRTELGVLELHGGFSRGHLTRYSALYTSFSTPFEVNIDDPAALSLPFPAGAQEPRGGQYTVRMERGNQVTLSAFQVDSNLTGFLHTEQMVELGGGLQLEGSGSDWRIVNGTRLPLQGVGIVRRDEQGELRGAWVGRLPSGGAELLRFEPLDPAAPWFDRWNDDPRTAAAEAVPEGQIPLKGMLNLALRQLRLRPGDARLVGWVEEPLEGLRIQPEIAQVATTTVVVGHLAFGPLPTPEVDVNLLADIEQKEPAPEGEPASGNAPGAD